MIFFFIVKSFSVMFYSSRDINLGIPFDQFGFDPFHRFTDYLMIWTVTGYENIYNLGNYFHAPPYGFVQLALLRYIPLRDLFYIKYINFLFILFLFLYINYLIYIKSIPNKNINYKILFLIFLILNYPIFFIIDRGNLDIYGGVFFSAIIVIIIKNLGNSKASYLNLLFLIAIISLKPSFGLYILPILFCYPIPYILVAILGIIFSYLIPIIFFGASYLYLIDAILFARAQISGVSSFCHNYLCSFRALGIKPNQYFLIGTYILYFIYNVYYIKKICSIKLTNLRMYGLILIATLGTLLLNDPSPDYRLILVIPLFLSLGKILNFSKLNKNTYNALIISSGLIFAYINIYISGFTIFNNIGMLYPAILKALGTVIFFHLLIIQITRLNQAENISKKQRVY